MKHKLLLVALAFLIVCSLGHCDEDNSDEFLDYVKSKRLKEILKTYKPMFIARGGMSELEKKCPGVTHKLQDAIKAFGQCDDAVDYSLTICTAIRNHALNCTEPLLKVVDDCLPQKAKELFNPRFNPCFPLWKGYLGYRVKCEKSVSDKIKKYVKDIPSTHNVCSLANDFKTCVKEDTEISCKNKKIKTVALGLYDALIHPCSTLVN